MIQYPIHNRPVKGKVGASEGRTAACAIQLRASRLTFSPAAGVYTPMHRECFRWRAATLIAVAVMAGAGSAGAQEPAAGEPEARFEPRFIDISSYRGEQVRSEEHTSE